TAKDQPEPFSLSISGIPLFHPAEQTPVRRKPAWRLLLADREAWGSLCYRNEPADRGAPVHDKKLRAWMRKWIDDLIAELKTGSQEAVWRAAQAEFKDRARGNPVINTYKDLAPAVWQRQGRRHREINPTK